MKIEHGAIRITEVPRVVYIDMNNTGCAIRFTGLINPIVFTKDELQEFHAALAEALKYSAAPFPTTVRSAVESREWKEGDPEPIDATVVIDCDGDVWVKGSGGWNWNGNTRSWQGLLSNHGPVGEAK